MGICTHTTDLPQRTITIPRAQRPFPCPNKISRHAATRLHDLVIQITIPCTLGAWKKHVRNPDLAPAGTGVQSQCVCLSSITSTLRSMRSKLEFQSPVTWCSCSRNMRGFLSRSMSRKSWIKPTKMRMNPRGACPWRDPLKEKNLHLLAKVKVPKNRGSNPLARVRAGFGRVKLPSVFT